MEVSNKKPTWLPQTVSDLDRHEGFREYAYPDPLSPLAKKYPASRHKWGFFPASTIADKLGLDSASLGQGRPWTVGHGFTKDVTPNTRISKKESLIRLEAEAIAHAEELTKLIPDWRIQYPTYVQTVLVNLIYNMGLARLSKFDTTLSLIKAKEFKKAGENLKSSLWYKQVGARAVELTQRLIDGKIADKHKV